MAARLRARRLRRRARGPRRAHALLRARDARLSLGIRRFRVRDARSGKRRDRRCSATRSCSGAICPMSRRAAASRLSRSPSVRPARTSRRWRRARGATAIGYVIDGEKSVDLQRRHRRSLRRVRAHRRRRGERSERLCRRRRDARLSRRANESRRCRRIRWVRCDSTARAFPRRCRIGKEGEGFKIAMATLDVFRSTVGAAAVGFARRALDESVDARENAQALRRAARRRCS